MLRSCIGAVLLALGLLAAARAEPPKSFVARVHLRAVTAGANHEIQTEVSGTIGQPLKLMVGGDDQLRLELDLRPLQAEGPRQYQAEFRLRKGDNTLSSPRLVTVAGQPAKIFVGAKDGDQIQIELLVREP